MMTTCVRPRAGRGLAAAWPLIPYMRANLRRSGDARARRRGHRRRATPSRSDLRRRAPELAHDAAVHDSQSRRHDAARRDAPQRAAPACRRRTRSTSASSRRTRACSSCCRPTRTPASTGRWSSPATDRCAPLEAEARARDIDVRMLGWLSRDDTLEWMRHAGVLAFPSYGPESLSRVLIEATALGVPIAAMDTGGTRDIVHPGLTGLLSTDAGRALARPAHAGRATSGCDPRSARRRGSKRTPSSRPRRSSNASNRCTAGCCSRGPRDGDRARAARRRRRPRGRAAARRRRPRAIGRRSRRGTWRRSGVAVTLITPPPRDEARRRRRGVRAPKPASRSRHVPYRTFPLRQPARHDGARSQHVVSGVRPARGPRGRRTRRGGRDRHRPRLRRQRAGLRAPARRGPRRSCSIRRASRSSAPPAGVAVDAETDGYAPLRAAVRRCARAADCIIATDRRSRTPCARHLQPAPGQMRTIPNGIDRRRPRWRSPDRPTARGCGSDHGIGTDDLLLRERGPARTQQGIRRAGRALGAARLRRRPLATQPWRWAGRRGPADRRFERPSQRLELVRT